MLRLFRKPVARISVLLALWSIIAQGSAGQPALQQPRSLVLPAQTIINDRCQPLLSSTDHVGFVASVTGGSLISFDSSTGQILSSVVIGRTAAGCSMIETGSRRLVAVSAANSPDKGLPVTVSVIDASDPVRLEQISLIVLPPEAHIMSTAELSLTSDGRFLLIPSYYDEPCLFCFDVATGAMVSRFDLVGRPSTMAIHERTAGAPGALIAVGSASANRITIVNMDSRGILTQLSSFSSESAPLDETNNLAFGSGGQVLYGASAAGGQVFAVDTLNGNLLGALNLSPSPARVTVAVPPDGSGDLLAVTRVPASPKEKHGGVTILTSNLGQMGVRAEFNPPEPIELSTVNNVVFAGNAETAFLGTRSGMLFAFDVTTGEMESYQEIGSELLSLAANDSQKTVAVTRRTDSSDSIVVVSYGERKTASTTDRAPVILSITPSSVEMGQRKSVRVLVRGKNFSRGSVVIYNGSTAAPTNMIGSKVLAAKLPPALFAQPGSIQLQVKSAGGSLSAAATLSVVPVAAAAIANLVPQSVPGPHAPFSLELLGSNFSHSSVVMISGQSLSTTFVSPAKIRTTVPRSLSEKVGDLSVQVVDSVTPGLQSNTLTLSITGPVIRSIKTSRPAILAGTGHFRMMIFGDNFRDHARVHINGQDLNREHVRMAGSKVIKAEVPPSFIQQAGNFPVVVVNRDGSASNAVTLNSLAPEVDAFAPGQVIAGVPDAKVTLTGANFRSRLRVTVGPSGAAPQELPRNLVQFKSKSKVVIRLSFGFNSLTSQPGTLNVTVLNPNKSGGVPSAAKSLTVSAPEITNAVIEPDKKDTSRDRIVITGNSFRPGATLQYLKDGQVVLDRPPEELSHQRVVDGLTAKKIRGLGSFAIQVVNPGGIVSNQFQPQPKAE